MKAVFHLGMHKTGTTSFQRALSDARDSLRTQGILYPQSPAPASFVHQHADMVDMARRGQFKKIGSYLDAVRAEAEGMRAVLFSSEEFSALSNDATAFDKLYAAVRSRFDDVDAVLVVRNLIDAIASTLLQQIDSGGRTPTMLFKESHVTQLMSDMVRKVQFIKARFPGVRIVDYKLARDSGDLNNYIARACLQDDAPQLANLRLNVAERRDEGVVSLLKVQLRGVLAQMHAASPYGSQVSAELATLLDESKLHQAVNADAAKDFARRYHQHVTNLVLRVYQSQADAIAESTHGLSAAERAILLPPG